MQIQKVPNQFPQLPPTNGRIALVGQSPGRDENWQGIPFVGESGKFLDNAIGRYGLVRAQCFVGNVCQVMPPEGKHFDAFDWEGPEVQEGIRQLKEDLERFDPDMVLCLGSEALHLLKHGNVRPPFKRQTKRQEEDDEPSRYDFPSKIKKWRGSLFETSFLDTPRKCMATYHPAAVLRDYKKQAYVGFDLERLRVESRTRELVLPKREIRVYREFEKAIFFLRELQRNKDFSLDNQYSTDIEGGPGNITSISFSQDPLVGHVIPFAHIDGSSVWTEEEETQLWGWIKKILEDPQIQKAAQNGSYDFFALAWTLGIVVRGWTHDAILAWWELYPELDKGLDVQASILTKEPFYKPDKDEESELKFHSDMEFWSYNGLDSCVTQECLIKELSMMDPGQREHYRFNMDLTAGTILYEMLRGIKVDKKRVKEEIKEAEEEAFRLQAMIDQEAGLAAIDVETNLVETVMANLGKKNPKVKAKVVEERWQPMKWNGKKWVKAGKLISTLPQEAISNLEELHWPSEGWGNCPDLPAYKPCPREVEKLLPAPITTLEDCEPFILESKQDRWSEVKKLVKQGQTDHLAWVGKLRTALGVQLNVSSTNEGGDSQRFLYEICGLPRIFKSEKGKYSKEADTDHRKRLRGEKTSIPPKKRISTDQNALDKLYAQTQDVRVLWVLQQRRVKKIVTDLKMGLDEDGRLRASVSLLKETGRMSEKKSPTGTGLNRQAFNKDLRRICVADEGMDMYQLDLSGADSWTVAAECAAVGDPTMLDDLQAGLKPAKVLCLIYLLGDQVNEWTPGEIKARLKEAEFPEWLYPAAKSCHHGTDYGMGWQTLSDTVLKYSMADLPIKLEDAKPIVLTKEVAEKFQAAAHSRYPGIKLWHRAESENLMTTGVVVTSAGHRRIVFGRKVEIKKGMRVVCHDTLKEILSSKPQFYTTLFTKIVKWRLWFDPENRTPEGDLVVEPLVSVHDSLVPQAPESGREFATKKLSEWFDNEIEIAGVWVKIPWEGTRGKDWGMDGEEVESL